ncbi:MAG: diguanylate cyclase, partial [Desulfosalsimonas sp.]
RDSTAYEAAAGYLSAGIEFLPPDSWSKDYRLTYDLYTELMECRYLTREFDEAERLFGTITANAATRADKANAYTLMIILYTNMRSPEDTIDLGLRALRIFGVRMSANTGTLPVLSELAKVKLRLARIQPENIPDLPVMQDPDRVACHSVMISMSTSAFYANPKLFALINLRAANEAFKYGVTEDAAAIFMSLAAIIGNILGDHETGCRIGEAALELNEKLDNRKIAGPVNHLYAFLIQHWKRHAAHDIKVYKKVYELCLDAGHLIYAGHSINAAADCRLITGYRLDDVIMELEKYRDFISHIQDPFIESRYRENIQMARCLKGLTESRVSLNEEGYDHDGHLERLYEEKNILGVCYGLLYRMKLFYLYGKYEDACTTAEKLDTYIHVPAGSLVVAEHYFYYCLTLAAMLSAGGFGGKSAGRRTAGKYLGKLKKFADLCPENFAHKHDLVLAELEASRGKFANAVRLYHAAAEGAGKNGYVNEQAIACERTGIFYLNIGAGQEAGIFLHKAHQCYGIWGASAKQLEMEERWPFLVRKHKAGLSGQDRTSQTSGDTGTRHLDLTTVMKASQAISSEIVLDSLLKNIMQISIANAGAQRGYLILDTNGRPAVVAGGDDEKCDVMVSEPPAVDGFSGISQSVVNYVWRSHEPVILANACLEGEFKNDPYIKDSLCRSVLCMPILNKGRLTGVLYMENNLAPNAFTEERLEILGAIVSQAAISIENARLFEQATTDGLTRLYVHRYFQFLLENELERCRRYGQACSLLMMDIDDFKHFNDTYGHQLGDEVLRQVSAAIRTNIRASDTAARYGGEEFVVVLPETEIDEAVTAAEKIRTLIENTEVEGRGRALRVTVSAGAAS